MSRDEILSASPSQINEMIDKLMDYKHGAGDYPNWSGDISAAWEVVEEMNGKFSFTIQRLGDYFYQDENYGWEAIFSSHSDRKVIAKTAPEAICKAALLTTLGADNP